ncbi:MAG: SCO family protein [Myxococcota bacterium]
MRSLPWVLALALSGAPGSSRAHEAHELEAETALLFALPEAGSYELPPIERVTDVSLLDSKGERVPLLGLERGELAIVAFIYRSCADAAGCPLSLATLQRLDRRLARRPELARLTRLVTVSFDPGRDTPERMAELRRLLSPRSDWRFLTASSADEIGGVLSDFGQDALRLATADGQETGVLRHVLKVFLVDGSGWIRNVYSAGFLDSRILERDLETVGLELRSRTVPRAPGATRGSGARPPRR